MQNLEFQREAVKIWNKGLTKRQQRQVERGKELFIGNEKREGWRGELPFYIFKCEACERATKDYPHGHIEHQYMLCSDCGARHDFVPWWASFAETWELIKTSFKFKFGHKI